MAPRKYENKFKLVGNIPIYDMDTQGCTAVRKSVAVWQQFIEDILIFFFVGGGGCL